MLHIERVFWRHPRQPMDRVRFREDDGGLLIGLHPGLVAVDLVDHKTVRVVALLEHVEAEVSRFGDGMAGVVQGGRDKRLAMLRPDVRVYENNVHTPWTPCLTPH